MSEHSTESTHTLPLTAVCEQRNGQLDLASLRGEEHALVQAVAQMACRSAGQAGDEGDPREQYDALHARLWATLEEWGLVRLTEDLGLDLEKIGRWQLTPAEWLWVNVGLIDVRLYDADADAAHIARTITEQLGERAQPALTILDFSAALLSEYRRRLGIHDILEQRAELSQHAEEARKLQAEVQRLQAEQHEFLEDMDEARSLLPVQMQIQELFPFIARITRARKAGASSNDLRTEMKARETLQRLHMRMQEAISNYSKRKTYDERQKEMLRAVIEFQDLHEQSRLGAGGGDGLDFGRRALEKAYREAFRHIRRQMNRISRGSSDCDPPFLLEREPRLTPKLIEEKWKQVLETCPRFQELEESGAGGRVRVLLLPGKGNPLVDRESGDVLASLFPIEVKLTSISAAIAESYFARDEDLRQSFALAARVSAREEGNLREAFRKVMSGWLHSREGRSTGLEARVEKWCRQYLGAR